MGDINISGMNYSDTDTEVKPGEEFRPAAETKTLYYLNLLLILIFGVFIWLIPLMIFSEPMVSVVVAPILVPFIAIYIAWVPMYYRSMSYLLTEDEINWQRGVWFRKTGIVPYSRITNVDIVQGPVMRMLGVSSLKIQTAGYSAQAQSEIRIEGIKNPGQLRDMIMNYVKGTVAADAGDTQTEGMAAGGDTDTKILEELVRIRKLLENGR